MEGTTTGCFDSLFAAFGKRNSNAESSRIPPAYTPPTEEKLPAYEECVSKVSFIYLYLVLLDTDATIGYESIGYQARCRVGT